MPLVSGVWNALTASDLAQTLPAGVTWNDGTNRLHFCKQASRDRLATLVAAFGWPLIGVFLSGSGGPNGIPDFIVHRSEFPLESGQNQADKVSTALDDQATTLYRDASGSRSFWANTHVWNYRADRLYTVRADHAGDFLTLVSDDAPPANWWQEYS